LKIIYWEFFNDEFGSGFAEWFQAILFKYQNIFFLATGMDMPHDPLPLCGARKHMPYAHALCTLPGPPLPHTLARAPIIETHHSRPIARRVRIHGAPIFTAS